MSNLTIQLTIIIGTVLMWAMAMVTFMLYTHYKHKKEIKRINKEIEERVNRPIEEGEWMTMEEEINQYWQRGRRPAIIPYDELRPKTDKLSPKKKVGKHTMR